MADSKVVAVMDSTDVPIDGTYLAQSVAKPTQNLGLKGVANYCVDTALFDFCATKGAIRGQGAFAGLQVNESCVIIKSTTGAFRLITRLA